MKTSVYVRIIIICTGFIVSLSAQTFIRTYHFPGMNGGLGLSKSSDGGFVGTGQHQGGPAGGCDVYVYRVSNCGNILWYKTFGSGGSDGGKKVIQASDGGFLVGGLWDDGSGSGASYDYMLMKLNAGGSVLWNTVWDMGSDDRCVWVEEVPFGIATCGRRYTGSNWEGIVSFYNTNGSPMWTKQLTGGGHDQPNSIHFSGGNFWVCGGTTSYGAGSGDLFLLKLDAAGNFLLGKTYGTSADERRGDWDIEGIPTNDGGYLIAGCTNNSGISAGGWDVMLIKVNSVGNVVWAKRYGGSSDDIAEGIAKTYDGGYVVVGYTYSFTNGGRDAFLLKIDSTGVMQWAKSYGDAGADRGIDVVNIGKEYVLSANREYTPGSGDYDPMFVKTDSLGVVGCNIVNAPFGVLDVTASIIVNTIPAASFTSISPSFSYPSPIVGSPSPSESFMCISCTAVTPSISVTPTVSCEGSPITLSNLSSITSAVCFEWLANGSPLNVSGLGTQTVTLPPGTYNIELRATCGNTINSVQQTEIVNPKPTANFSYTDHICVDKQPVNYFNTGSSGGGYTYQWYLGNGATPSTTTTVNATNVVYAFGGSKNVSLVVTNIYGCKDSTTKTITIEPLPNLVFSATNPTCVNDTVYFTNYSWLGGSGTIANWYWDFGDGNTSNVFQPKHIYTTAGNYTVMLTATSDYGCEDTLYHIVNISPPTIAGSVISNATVCATNNSGTLNIVGNNGNVVYWEYSNDGGVNWYSISNITTTQTYSNLPTTTIYRALIQSGSCPSAYTSPNATITVDAPSNAGVLLKDTVVCASGNSGTLSITNYTGSVQDWYSSTDGVTWTGLGNTTSFYSFSNLGTSTWYYAIVKSGTCPADTTNIVYVNVSPATVPGSAVSNQTLCILNNSGSVTVNNYTGTIVQWESSTDGGVTWYPIVNTTSVQVFSGLSTTTKYRVKVKSGVCPDMYSNEVIIQIDDLSRGGKIMKDTVVCWGTNTGTLTLVSYSTTILDWIGSTDNGMSWTNFGYTNPVYTFTNLSDTTIFKAIVQNGVCPADTSEPVVVYVNYFNDAKIVPAPDTTISLGYSVQVTASGGINYIWAPNYNISDTTLYNPFVWPTKDTTYTVYVRNQYGCLDTATVRIFVLKDYKLIIANTMTPNGDNYNDFFWIGMIEHYPNNEVMIFNRYGQMIYIADKYDNQKVYWDGTYQGNKVPDGAYYYVIKFTDSNVIFKGSINVISSH